MDQSEIKDKWVRHGLQYKEVMEEMEQELEYMKKRKWNDEKMKKDAILKKNYQIDRLVTFYNQTEQLFNLTHGIMKIQKINNVMMMATMDRESRSFITKDEDLNPFLLAKINSLI